MNKDSNHKNIEYIYFNNSFIASTDACIAYNDRGFTLGDGVFETMLSYKSNIAFFDQHWQRLTKSAAVLDIKIPSKYSKQSVYSVIKELLNLNCGYQNLNLKGSVIPVEEPGSSQQDLGSACAALDRDDNNHWHGIKIILTRGAGPRSVEPLTDYNYDANLIISSFKAKEPSLSSKSLIISDYKINQTSPLSKIKSLNYLDRILAKQHALDNNYDDALLVNFDNNICSATTSNVFFMLDNNTVITPPISDGTLPGITRDWVINYLRQSDYSVLEQSLNRENLDNIKSAFLTNSIMGIAKINKIGSKEDEEVSVKHDNLLSDMLSRLVSYHV